jgi:hypothetical protein
MTIAGGQDFYVFFIVPVRLLLIVVSFKLLTTASFVRIDRRISEQKNNKEAK